MKRITAHLFIIIALYISSCQNDTDSPINSTKLEMVTGYVQKGPFINGSSITLSELNADLAPTGKNYNVQIIDNRGAFKIKNLALSSPFAEFKANGFYFNEVTGENSIAQLTLLA